MNPRDRAAMPSGFAAAATRCRVAQPVQHPHSPVSLSGGVQGQEQVVNSRIASCLWPCARLRLLAAVAAPPTLLTLAERTCIAGRAPVPGRPVCGGAHGTRAQYRPRTAAPADVATPTGQRPLRCSCSVQGAPHAAAVRVRARDVVARRPPPDSAPHDRAPAAAFAHAPRESLGRRPYGARSARSWPAAGLLPCRSIGRAPRSPFHARIGRAESTQAAACARCAAARYRRP
jgi:hypothetical protein